MASIEQAVAALNAAAAGVLGFEPALSFAGARDAEHLVASFGALVTACKSAQAAASAAELSAARQYAAADRLDKAVHASRARIDSLEAQVSRQEAELDRRSKALSGAMHREAQREATLRRREREIERMQARLADKLRGGAKSQLIEAPVLATPAVKGAPARPRAGGGSLALLVSALQAARKREAAAAADGQRQAAAAAEQASLISSLQAAIRELQQRASEESAPPNLTAEAATATAWLDAARETAKASLPRVSLVVNLGRGDAPPAAADAAADLEECRRQLREQDQLLQMALDSRLPSPLRPLRDISPNRRSGAATPPSAKAAAREALSEERRLLREQRERLLERAAAVDEAAEAVDQRRRALRLDDPSLQRLQSSVPDGAALASFLDSLNERLFTPTTTGPCATAADGGLSPPTPSSRSRRLFASRAAGAPKPADPPNDPPAAGSDEAAGPSEAPAAGPSPIPPLVSIERC